MPHIPLLIKPVNTVKEDSFLFTLQERVLFRLRLYALFIGLFHNFIYIINHDLQVLLMP